MNLPTTGGSALCRGSQRSVTDPCALVTFFLAWGLMLCVIAVAFRDGSVSRVLHGTDYLGNTCGSSEPLTPVVSLTNSGTSWANRQVLWYPVSFVPSAGSFDVSAALLAGLCLAECPVRGNLVDTYGPATPNVSSSMPASLTALFNSSLRIGRCIPQLETYNCGMSLKCHAQRLSAAARCSSYQPGGGR